MDSYDTSFFMPPQNLALDKRLPLMKAISGSASEKSYNSKVYAGAKLLASLWLHGLISIAFGLYRSGRVNPYRIWIEVFWSVLKMGQDTDSVSIRPIFILTQLVCHPS